MKLLEKQNISDIIALSPLQEGILYLYLKNPGSAHYVEQLGLQIHGHVTPAYFEAAWNRVIADNEMLRTVFRWNKMEQPVQIILKGISFQPQSFDFSNLKLQNADSTLRILDSELRNPDSKLQTPDSELHTLDSKLQNWDLKLQNVDSKLQNRAKMAENSRHQRCDGRGRTTLHHCTAGGELPLILQIHPKAAHVLQRCLCRY